MMMMMTAHRRLCHASTHALRAHIAQPHTTRHDTTYLSTPDTLGLLIAPKACCAEDLPRRPFHLYDHCAHIQHLFAYLLSYTAYLT